MKPKKDVVRCAWASNERSIPYHDREWGVPLHDDRVLFEFLILEGAQAGLSWDTILRKRENYRAAFDGFDPKKIARYDQRKAQRPAARRGHRPQPPEGGFGDSERQGLSGGARGVRLVRRLHLAVRRRPAARERLALGEEIPARTPQSDAMSKDLKRRGFNFVGSTICYAFMQAIGMVNDHAVECFRYRM